MEFSESERYLISTDSLLAEIIKSNGPISPRQAQGYFAALASSIISQQISLKAAASIFERFKAETNLDPKRVSDLSQADSKYIGLSGRKLSYLRDLASYFVSNPTTFDHLEKLPDDEVIAQLTRVKGVGVWTAQMFLLFTLDRPDIFAPADRGLQIAMMKVYQLDAKTKPNQLEELARAWQPYRSTASLHLWKSLDNKPS